MKRLTLVALLAFLCLKASAQKTDSLVVNNYTYQKVAELTQFPELRYLKIYDYADSVLPDIFSKLTKLEYLELYNIEAKEIPPSIGELSKLKTLIVCNGYSDITIPAEIGKLKALTKLEIYNYYFKTVPAEIGNLVNLEKVMLCGDLTELPSSIKNWKKVTSLYLANNQFKEIPEPIFQLTLLKYLDLSKNELSQLNDSIRVLKNLDELGLEGNVELSQLPPHFCELEKLKDLYIQNTKINALPSCLNQMSSLKRIRMCKTVIDDPEALEIQFKEKIDWDGFCRGLEKHLVDFSEIFGQTTLKYRETKDTTILLYTYSYNDPRSIDEEFTRNITIKIRNIDSLVPNKVYTTSNSHFLITTSHSSVWDWGPNSSKNISGYLFFKELKKDHYTVYLNLDNTERREKWKLVEKLLVFDEKIK